MARERPTASNVEPPALTVLDGGRPHADRVLLTRSQEHALRRCESLTHAQLKKHLEPLAEPRLRTN